MTTAAASRLEALLGRDRAIVLAALGAVTALAWAWLIAAAAGMGGMADTAMPRLAAWTAAEAGAMFVMWAVMMVGMMLPAAAPMLLLYAVLARKQRAAGAPLAPTGAFAAGYLIAWIAFSALATGLQWALEQAALVSPMMVSTSPWLGGGLLIAAGVYQWTPLKRACLKNCRTPIQFLSRAWRNGTAGAVAMGVHHGVYCVGCCWFLMALLFVGGVMNLLWVAAITAFVFVEKVAPAGVGVGRASGVLLALAGAVLLLSA